MSTATATATAAAACWGGRFRFEGAAVNIVAAARELAGRRVCVAIGMFDGVHLGHQQVLRQTTADARQHGALPVAVTFDQHPNAVVAPERNPPLIYPLARKLSALADYGIAATVLIPFDRALSQLPADVFVRELVAGVGQLHSICVGSSFVFGHRRSGNVDLLRELGRTLRFSVHGVSAISLDGLRVSSTRIRQEIQAGRLDAASQMLGRPYSIFGRVIRGQQRGRTIGVPTANLDIRGLALPPSGVYASQVLWQGRVLMSVTNIGVRPTVDPASDQLTVETHVLEFNGDLYDAELEVVLGAKLRDEVKFSSLAALQAQIVRDKEQAREWLTGDEGDSVRPKESL